MLRCTARPHGRQSQGATFDPASSGLRTRSPLLNAQLDTSEGTRVVGMVGRDPSQELGIAAGGTPTAEDAPGRST